MTTNTSSQLTKTQDKLAVANSENRRLVKKLERVRTMIRMYSAIKKEVADEIVNDIDETLGGIK